MNQQYLSSNFLRSTYLKSLENKLCYYFPLRRTYDLIDKYKNFISYSGRVVSKSGLCLLYKELQSVKATTCLSLTCKITVKQLYSTHRTSTHPTPQSTGDGCETFRSLTALLSFGESVPGFLVFHLVSTTLNFSDGTNRCGIFTFLVSTQDPTKCLTALSLAQRRWQCSAQRTDRLSPQQTVLQ